MKTLFALVFLALSFTALFGQNEQSPIVEKEFAYNDWTLENIRSDSSTNLREFTAGKKLVMVVYFAPWCPNWKHDLAFVQGLYDKYKDNGFDVIAIGEYDPLDSMKSHLKDNKLTFPAVYESLLRTDMQKTLHYNYRKATGDMRKWGSPWYVFLEPANIEKSGDTISKRANVVNGELIKDDAEMFIRAKLGLSVEPKKVAVSEKEIEVCEQEKKTANLVKP
ncbi:MAG: redoxin domain-containing protein [Saprospiraceae bacterium]|nr:redoxin domain-containing protein [Pyrinomonadaceae bacterium]